MHAISFQRHQIDGIKKSLVIISQVEGFVAVSFRHYAQMYANWLRNDNSFPTFIMISLIRQRCDVVNRNGAPICSKQKLKEVSVLTYSQRGIVCDRKSFAIILYELPLPRQRILNYNI